MRLEYLTSDEAHRIAEMILRLPEVWKRGSRSGLIPIALRPWLLIVEIKPVLFQPPRVSAPDNRHRCERLVRGTLAAEVCAHGPDVADRTRQVCIVGVAAHDGNEITCRSAVIRTSFKQRLVGLIACPLSTYRRSGQSHRNETAEGCVPAGALISHRMVL